MPQMTPAQARVIDPVLSEVARGYQNAELIGLSLFPAVTVGQRGGKIIQFGKEQFQLYNTARAPGSRIARIQSGHSSQSFALEDHGIAEGVPVELMEEAEAVPGVDLGMAALRRAQDVISLRLEKSQADLALNASAYAASNKVTLSGASQWSDFSGTSDPIAVIETAKEAVRALVARRPNTLVMGAKVFASLKQHPKVIDRIKYTGRDVPTAELLASLFGVARVLVGDAVYVDAAGVVADVWGKHAVLAYTETAGVNDAGRPSFGYTYRLRGYPMVEPARYDADVKSWIYGVHDALVPVIAGAEAGYLITNAVA